MTRREYGLLEDHIINTFRNDRVFLYHGKMCEAIEADKPRPQSMGGLFQTQELQTICLLHARRILKQLTM